MINSKEVDLNSFVPVYYQIAQDIKTNIQNGVLKEGHKIPTEKELCNKYLVSRMTVRQAIDQLVHEGLVVRKKGVGTFVAVPKPVEQLASLINFTKKILSIDMIPSSKVLFFDYVEAPAKVAEQLSIKPGERTIKLTRVRFANDKPYTYEMSYLINSIGSKILKYDLNNRSLYETIQEVCGVAPFYAKEWIEAAPCSEDIAYELQIQPNDVVFHIERTTYDKFTLPIEYVQSNCRIDEYKFFIERRV